MIKVMSLGFQGSKLDTEFEIRGSKLNCCGILGNCFYVISFLAQVNVCKALSRVAGI